MEYHFRHYISAMGSILDIMPANDYQRILDNEQGLKNKIGSDCLGPLPPPDVLKDYESILSGSTERILLFREKEQKFQYDNQKLALDGMIKKDRRGQWMGFSIAMFILIIATLFAFRGEMVFAGTLITIDLIGLAAVFVIGRKLGAK
ncbi:DUF2335 domain-containing protein [Xenorhabdus cabanillasii]|uniref:Uncharacterized protein n=1 Tax=Xenorhabdus cabanillasii JM26 TaxID=1427517 RepID=W1J9R3_9GAMM|nr:DUF2335 domain-containing protein [Xenorhabdus cabanillasii]PHM76563.1 hypothetical protein Xcab_02862 [Xenorhabdus cabanillasii JM26]CDL86616.1 conserved hypothetical protein [Xenorhabdus cabanillasii JM26]